MCGDRCVERNTTVGLQREVGPIPSNSILFNSALQAIADAMSRIGYEEGLLCTDYEYALLDDDACATRRIPLAGFAQAPPSYRNSCIGVIGTNGLSGESNVAVHRDLGAPLIFEVGSTTVSWWSFDAKGKPRFIDQVPQRQIRRAFRRHRTEWGPSSIFRLKALHERHKPAQLDFFDLGYLPLLESMVKEKLDGLLGESLRETRKAYRDATGKDPDPKELFRLVFRFIAAKTLGDRNHPGNWTSSDPMEILREVETYYSTGAQGLAASGIQDSATLATAWDCISGSLRFQNLSADDLAFVYENTLITPQTRKRFGTHSTPPSIAEYIVRKLPIHSLDEKGRRILEPCSGHGIFLVSAMRRLRELLPASMSNARRHNYLRARLVGIETDPFAVEVCRLSLMLADYPNRNDWKLYNEDVFDSGVFRKELSKADCVLCNPPFEDFSNEARRRYENLRSVHQPAEVLWRVLDGGPAILGFVLPKSFLTGPVYRGVQRKLAEAYGVIELVALPDRVFNFSDSETVLLLTWDRRHHGRRVQVACRTVTEDLRNRFLGSREEPPARSDTLSLRKDVAAPFSIWIPKLPRLWLYLSDYETLGEHADMHRGVEYNIPLDATAIARKMHATSHRDKGQARRIADRNRKRVFSDVKKAGFVAGVQTASGSIVQFALLRTSYLKIQDKLMRTRAHQHPWRRSKLLVNSVRLSRGPWRIAAVQDTVGLYAYTNCYGIWPRDVKDLLSLMALINSPVANAYVYFNASGKHNLKAVVQRIPIPALKADEKMRVEGRITHYQTLLSQHAGSAVLQDERQIREALLHVDAELLRSYDLPPVLERELLDEFQGWDRPVPFIKFTGYYPEEFSAFLPLHRIISEEFEYARADILLQRLQALDDSIIHEVLEDAAGSQG